MVQDKLTRVEYQALRFMGGYDLRCNQISLKGNFLPVFSFEEKC